MPTIFFTSDHHFGHKNILNHCNRPFSSVEEMDEELIRRWNEKIKPGDEVYHLGDFALNTNAECGAILDRLNGTKYLLTGNHEGAALSNKKKFKWVKEYHELKVPDGDCANGVQRIVLFHYAMRRLPGHLAISKDNYIFGVVSVDAAGHESVPVLPVVGRQLFCCHGQGSVRSPCSRPATAPVPPSP